MNPSDPKAALLEVFERCQQQMPEKLAKNLVLPRGDPAPLKKQDTNILRLRVLPVRKVPEGFWNASWCFYEVGLGVYSGKLTVGGVMFVQFPFQTACGNSRYWRPVISILQKLQQASPVFELTCASDNQRSTLFQRAYRNKDFPFFPVKQAAQDLAWLIQETLPTFEAIQ